MMQALNGGYSPIHHFPQQHTYSHDASFLDDWSNHMAIAEASRRLSRVPSNPSRRAAATARVTKPLSAHTSPTAVMKSSGSRMNAAAAADYRHYHHHHSSNSNIDNAQQQPPVYHATSRRQQQQPMYPGGAPASRPVSWHPSSYIMAPTAASASYPGMDMTPSSCYPLSTPTMYTAASAGYAHPISTSDMDASSSAYPLLSPTAAAVCHSTNVSPCSTFSLPTTGGAAGLAVMSQTNNNSNNDDDDDDNHRFASPDNTVWTHHFDGLQQGSSSNYFAQQQPPSLTPAESTLEWHDDHVLGGITTPPTPEAFIQQQHQQLTQQVIPQEEEEEVVVAGDDDGDDDGEILIGMGLYDTPDKMFCEDPQLDNYRSTMSCLLGSTYRSSLEAYQPMGKGLTLEKAWEPPTSDDGEDDADGDEE